MAKKETDIAVKDDNNVMTLPSYLQGLEAQGTELLSEFVKPPRIKVVQKQSSSELLTEFAVGDVIVSPQRILVAPMIAAEKGKIADQGNPFVFVPIFFYPEWVAWNPVEMKGSLSSIRGRTLDPTDVIAVKSRDSNLRQAERVPEAPPGKDFKIRYVEHLNFICMLQGVPALENIAVALSFARGSHSNGSNLCSLIKLRKAPLFACAFQGVATFRSNAQGEWYSILPTNPAKDLCSPWLPENLVTHYKGIHEEYKDLHAKKLIQVGLDDDDTETVNPADSKDF